ncbi:MAG: Bax inhibitor-1/YccA family protein [Pseudomonadota bacterium]
MADFERQTTAVGRAGAQTRADIDEGLRAYMLRVYNLMGLGVAVTAIVTLFMASQPALMQTIAMGPMKWVLFAGVLGLGFFAPKVIFTGSQTMAHAAYWSYAVLWGLLISPMIFAFMAMDGGATIAKAFFITSATFGAVSIYGYTTKRDLSPFATFFFMAAIGILIAMLVNVFFFQSSLFSLVTSGIVVLLFSAITAYETQMIKEMYFEGDSAEVGSRKAIFGAFALYGSFITLFIHILNIMGIMRSE